MLVMYDLTTVDQKYKTCSDYPMCFSNFNCSPPWFVLHKLVKWSRRQHWLVKLGHLSVPHSPVRDPDPTRRSGICARPEFCGWSGMRRERLFIQAMLAVKDAKALWWKITLDRKGMLTNEGTHPKRYWSSTSDLEPGNFICFFCFFVLLKIHMWMLAFLKWFLIPQASSLLLNIIRNRKSYC